MTKKQKIWFAVFLAMFLVPEVLLPQITPILFYWVREVLFGISLKLSEQVQFNPFGLREIPFLVDTFFALKFFGLIMSFVFSLIYYHPKYKLLKFLLVGVLGSLLLVAVFYIMFAVSFNNIKIG